MLKFRLFKYLMVKCKILFDCRNCLMLFLMRIPMFCLNYCMAEFPFIYATSFVCNFTILYYWLNEYQQARARKFSSKTLAGHGLMINQFKTIRPMVSTQRAGNSSSQTFGCHVMICDPLMHSIVLTGGNVIITETMVKITMVLGKIFCRFFCSMFTDCVLHALCNDFTSTIAQLTKLTHTGRRQLIGHSFRLALWLGCAFCLIRYSDLSFTFSFKNGTFIKLQLNLNLQM